MKINLIKYSHEYTFHGLSRWIGMEASIDESDNEKECLHKLEQTAKEFVQESFKQLEKTTATEMQPAEPPILPVIEGKKTTPTKGFEGYSEAIKQSSTIEELKEYHTIASMNPKLMKVYNEKLNSFQS